MELKKGPLSVLQLIWYGVKAANQAFGAVILLFILVFFINIFAGLVASLAVWLFHKYALLIQIPLILVSMLLGMMVPLALIKIIASKIEKTGITAWESLISSTVPALYLFVSSLVLMIPAGLILVGAVLSKSALVLFAVYVVMAFLMLPFMFVQHAIALRGEGPISALKYSWELSTSHYVRILFTIISIIVLFIIFLLGIVCVLKVFLPQFFANPAMLQMQLLMLPKIYALLGFMVFMLLYAFILLAFQAIFTVLFLNLDYCHRMVKTRENDTPRVKATANILDSLGLETEVGIKQASVQTDANEDTIQHLEQVYSPNDHLPQTLQQEEDRMPTILFDEDIAKQLAQHDEQKLQKSSDNPDDQEPPSIKMSNKSL